MHLWRSSRAAAIASICLSIFNGCAKQDSGPVFRGTWNIIKEDGIGGQKTQAIVKVTADGNTFTISRREDEAETIDIYDGTTLTHKVNELQNSPISQTTPQSDNQVEPLRFWKNHMTEQSSAGGIIAGRDTILFQSQSKHPENEITIQCWVDAKTGVALKKIITVYSPQLEQIVSKKTEECQDIRYGS